MQNRLKIVSIGDRVFPGDYILHSRFRQVVNFIDGERLATVVTGEVGRGPVNIVVQGNEFDRLKVLRVDADKIYLNNETIPFDRGKIYYSQIRPEFVDLQKLEENLASFEKALIILSPSKSLAFLLDAGREANFSSSFEKEFLKRIKDAVGAIFDGKLPHKNSCVNPCNPRLIKGAKSFLSGIKKLKGVGFGLTPSGDDFITGLLAGMNSIEVTLGVDLENIKEKAWQAARGGNLLSNSFIKLAKDGFLFERFRRLVLSLLHGNQNQVFESAKSLIAHGETSGSDMGVGFLLTLKSLNLLTNGDAVAKFALIR